LINRGRTVAFHWTSKGELPADWPPGAVWAVILSQREKLKPGDRYLDPATGERFVVEYDGSRSKV